MLIHEAMELSYFTRGSMSYEYVLLKLSVTEREILGDFIHDRIKTEVKSPKPNY